MSTLLTTIKGRLYLVFTVIFALMLAVATLITTEKSSLQSTLDNAIRTGNMMEALGDITTALNGMDASAQSYASTGLSEYYQRFQQQEQELLEQINFTRQQTSSDQTTRLQQLTALQQSFDQHKNRYYAPLLETGHQLARSQQDPEALQLARSMLTSLNGILELADTIEEEVQAAFERRITRADDQLDRLQWVALAAVALVLLVILLLALPVVISIARRLDDVIEVAEQVGAGNLSNNIQVTGKDEVSKVLHTFASMRQRLRDLVQTLQSQSEQLASSSSQVAESAGAISQATEEQSQASDLIAAAVEELTVSIGHVSESARQAFDNSEEARSASERGSSVIQATVSSMNRIAEESLETAEKLHELNQRSTKISQIVDQIQAIAEQTNLLALNAAIESARAGEHGRGFAVVADEVRQLAQRSSDATDEIATMVSGIQTEIEQAVSSMQRTVEVVNTGSEQAAEAGKVIEEVRNGAISTADVINQTSSALEEQTAVSQDVAQQVENIASMTVETAAAATQASTAARALQEIAEEMRSSVAWFKT
ncbi:methyl-accepting chemotaxis protein [Marinospirillum alkaliphilum]|uniref:Methyl-accepting chemotaxis protein n=1 Tax=Marinospirillum alkaliphilum DSM 21637 TaxID=1122209 RepID=A0A1K1ZY23_9GAMM|nr:methyl-accepting chemotaxis protein [Marinospirillum alkaliphilum]SFX78349.1 methyl-accepting chemotaxis protein [Marinospirillum alkaliphilum DSM 21637]